MSRLSTQFFGAQLIGDNTFSGLQTIIPASTSTIGLILRGNASQVADLQRWQDSAGTTLASVVANGVMRANRGLVINNSASANYTALEVTSTITNGTGMVVKGVSGQTANLQEWQDSAGTILSKINSSGWATFARLENQGLTSIGTAVTGTSSLLIDTNVTTRIGMIIKGVASQSANLQQWQDSAGVVLSSIDSLGTLTVQGNQTWSTTLQPNNLNFSRGSSTYLTNTTAGGVLIHSATTTAAGDTHVWNSSIAGLLVNSAGHLATTATPLRVRGSASQTGNLQEWQDSSGTVLTAVSASGGVTVNGRLWVGGDATAKANIYTSSTTQIGLAIRGVSSQTANLTEWQNSAGSVVAQVNSAGAIFSNSTISTTADVRVANGVISYGYTNVYSALIGVAGGTPTNETTLIVKKRNGSETGNFQEWQDSSGTVLGSVSSTGALTTTGDITAGNNLRSSYSAGDEGGQIFLNKPVTNTSIVGGVNIDVYQNRLRIWEDGGTNRGVYIDITAAGAGVGTNLLTGGTGGTGTVTSVAMTVPTGLSISGSPITGSGTLALTLTSGYSIPTTSSQTNWDTAYTDRNKWDGGSTGLTAATGRTSLGATTVGSSIFTLTDPSAITFLRINADNTVSALSDVNFRTAIGAGTGNGTVTSVTGTSPVSSSGGATPAISLASGYGDTQNPYASKTANYVLAGPVNGTSLPPSFRALVAADIPNIAESQVTNLTTDLAAKAVAGSNGVPFAMAANATTTAGGTALAANAQETVTGTTITFPASRFSVTPAITANTSSPRYVVAITSASSTGFTMIVRNVSDATGTTYTYNWMAVQMTSGAVGG